MARRKKPHFDTKLFLVIVLAAFFASSLLAYIGRGTIRSDILPMFANTLHAKQLETVLTTAEANGNTAIQPLHIKMDKRNLTECSLDSADKLYTSVGCRNEAFMQAKQVVGKLDSNDQRLQSVVATMKATGWNGGIDNSNSYQVIYFNKTMNDIDCRFQLFVTASTNKVSSRIFCSKTYYYFGNPLSH